MIRSLDRFFDDNPISYPLSDCFIYTTGMPVPKIIHQSYKTTDHPYPVDWQRSWQEQNPGWKYHFHTDADNRALVSRHFPEFLEPFDAFPLGIMRADFSRFLYLYLWGGVYADLDYTCLRPLDSLAESVGSLGIPSLPTNDRYQHHNALLLSDKGNPFWLTCASAAIEYFTHEKQPLVEELAGPLRIQYELDRHHPQYVALSPEQVTPIDWYSLMPWGRPRPKVIKQYYNLRNATLDALRNAFPEAYAITFWLHGWHEAPRNRTPGTSPQ